jgi:hypothetical protein
VSGKPVFAPMAAIGRLIALAALLAGAPAAMADELSDLRANDQLLQQRLDQIERTQAAPGSPAGSAVTRGSFPRSYTIPGTDTSIRVGGTVSETLDYRAR